MYKISITLVILVSLMCLSPNVYAHPPSNINLVYKESSQIFTLTINHRIQSKGHFIKQLTVKLNGEDLQSKKFPFQNNKKIVFFSFPVPQHEKGDILSIEIICNRTGPMLKDFSLDRVMSDKTAK